MPLIEVEGRLAIPVFEIDQAHAVEGDAQVRGITGTFQGRPGAPVGFERFLALTERRGEVPEGILRDRLLDRIPGRPPNLQRFVYAVRAASPSRRSARE